MDPQLQEAYVAVERAYSQGQFPAALERAQQLAGQVAEGTPDELALRLRLLTAHIHLYGLQQPAQAEPLYQRVLEQTSDRTYHELARHGLTLCAQLAAATPQPNATGSADGGTSQTPPPIPAALDAAFPGTAPDSAATGATAIGAAAAMPWLSDLAGGGQAPAAAMAPQEREATLAPGEAEPEPAEPDPAEPEPAGPGAIRLETRAETPHEAAEVGGEPTTGSGGPGPEQASAGATALAMATPEPPQPEPEPEPIEPELLEPEWIEPEAPPGAAAGRTPAGGDTAHSPLAFSPAEAAELAKGLLLVKLA